MQEEPAEKVEAQRAEPAGGGGSEDNGFAEAEATVVVKSSPPRRRMQKSLEQLEASVMGSFGERYPGSSRSPTGTRSWRGEPSLVSSPPRAAVASPGGRTISSLIMEQAGRKRLQSVQTPVSIVVGGSRFAVDPRRQPAVATRTSRFD